TSLFGLTTTVGQENVGDLDTQLVVAVEHLEGFPGLGNGVVTVGQDTVNVESESHVLSSLHLLLGHVLHLRGQNVPRDGGLSSGHNGGQTGDTGGSRDGQRGTKGVTRTPTVPA